MTDLHVEKQVIGRDSERSSILDFVDGHASSKRGGVMYIAGSPGTGKTLCTLNVLNEWVKQGGKAASARKYEYLNVIGVKDHLKVFLAIEQAIKNKSFVSQLKKRGRSAKISNDVGETFALVADCVASVVDTASDYLKAPTTVIFVLDEIDYLCPSLSSAARGGTSRSTLQAKKQVDLVSSLFSLPGLLAHTNCTLILVGIANSIDLSNRLMTMFNASRARTRAPPVIDKTLLFRPYSASELKAIVNEVTDDALDAVAVEVCSRKVAAIHGDCRKVIDLCKQAASKSRREGSSSQASVQHLMSVLDSAYKSQAESATTLKALPLQQLLVLVAACKYAKSHSERSEFEIGCLKSSLLQLTRTLNIQSSVVGHISTMTQHVEALSSSGLMSLRLSKQRGETVTLWSLNCPAGQLEETLKKTNDLIASALGEVAVRE